MHTRVHGAMLRLAIRQSDGKETLGQIVRIAVAAIGSFTGRFPLGNTGRATAPLMLPMAIPQDLTEVLAAAGCATTVDDK